LKYIILYRLCGVSRARITGTEFKKKMKNTNISFADIERFPDADKNQLIKKFN